MPAVIVLGDRTDHGGVVIEASGSSDTHGKRLARVGDKVHCPKKGHGAAVIVTGDNTFVDNGKAVAYHGCKTSCGATLISSQGVTTINFSSGNGAAFDSNRSAGMFTSLIPLSKEEVTYDMQYEIREEGTDLLLANIPYLIKLDNGQKFQGKTDANGLTEKVGAKSEIIAEIEVPYYGDGASTTYSHSEHSACGC